MTPCVEHNTILPAKDITMKSDENKRTLIQYNNVLMPAQPILSSSYLETLCHEEEADVNSISSLLQIIPHRRHIQILADDTDIIVLLIFLSGMTGLLHRFP